MSTQVIIQARLGSQRLPRKVLCEIAPTITMLDMVVQRVSRATRIDGLIIATTTEPADNELAEYCRSKNWHTFRGSESDVLSRYMGAADQYDSSRIVRITSDCPLIDPELIDRVIALHDLSCCDYASNVIQRSYPRGLDIEVFTRTALRRASREATHAYQREHVTPYINQHPDKFSLVHCLGQEDLSGLRWTVDTWQDFSMVQRLIEKIGNIQFSWTDALDIFLRHPEIAHINAEVEQKPLRAA